MPVVAVVLMTLTFWVLYWFVRMGGIAHFQARAKHREDEARRAAARELERTACLRAVDDPRDAAIVLMLLIARGGDPNEQEVATVEDIAAQTFGFDVELIERMTHARFIASRADGFGQAGKIFSVLLNDRLTRDERLELIAMVETVARHDGPSKLQTEAIAALRQRLGIEPFA
jgi:uncharacterized tellurite resistance protein B-like protein